MEEDRMADERPSLDRSLQDLERVAEEADDEARLTALQALHQALEDEVEQTSPPGR
jgi:hypothetical protein